MAPKVAVEKIKRLLISTTESGTQDHHSLLDAYKKFEKYLGEENIQRPVVLLSDGHSSRFDFNVLKFLRESNIHLYISPPDTTGVTQLLDQSPNQKLHQEYNKKRDELFSPFQTINREGFMQILGEIWDQWAPEETIINAAERVGISKVGLDVNKMQQDKFDQAARCMEGESSSVIVKTPEKSKTRSATTPVSAPNTPRSQLKLAKAKFRYGSRNYYKYLYEQSMGLIKDGYEKSLNLEEIPGLMTVHKVKPKDIQKKNTRITNVHGSMEGQDMLSKVESIELEKKRKVSDKEEKTRQKEEEKEVFYRCKTKCVCKGECQAKFLRECPNCHSVMKSTCSKAGCQKDGKKPVMLRAASSTMPVAARKRKVEVLSSSDDDDDVDDTFESYDDSGDDDDNDVSGVASISGDGDDDDDDAPNQLENEFDVVKKSWKSLSPPNSELQIQGKWYGVIYRGGKSPMLHVAKVLMRELYDVEGPVKSIQLECLMHKIGSGNVLKAPPAHLPDREFFPLHDIIYGPMDVIPKARDDRAYVVKDYEQLKSHFEMVKTADFKNI